MIVDFFICEVKECRSRKRENCNFVLAVVLLAAAERNRKEWIRIFELYISQAKHFSRGTNMVRHSAKWCTNARGDFGSALSRKLSALVLTEERKASIVEHNNYERSFLSSFLSTVAGFARISRLRGRGRIFSSWALLRSRVFDIKDSLLLLLPYQDHLLF